MYGLEIALGPRIASYVLGRKVALRGRHLMMSQKGKTFSISTPACSSSRAHVSRRRSGWNPLTPATPAMPCRRWCQQLAQVNGWDLDPEPETVPDTGIRDAGKRLPDLGLQRNRHPDVGLGAAHDHRAVLLEITLGGRDGVAQREAGVPHQQQERLLKWLLHWR